jgi:type III pantothenate kinase
VIDIILLVIDAGNTNIVFGIFKNDILINSYRMTTIEDNTVDQYGMFIHKIFELENITARIDGAIISSVVARLTGLLNEAVQKYLKIEPIIVDTTMDLDIDIKYDNKRELGTDRFVSAVAGFNIYKKALIIVDFGTATTFGAISSKGEFLGGAICPGINVSFESLANKTSLLPKAIIGEVRNAIGKNTISNIQSGVIIGHIGQVKYLIERIKSEMNEDDVTVIATGGLASIIAKETIQIDQVREDLILEGLKIIYYKINGINKT